MPITAGILDILNGAFGILLGLLFVAFAFEGRLAWGPLFEIGGPVLIVIGVIAIVGSIFAFKRKRWWLALVGAIISIAPTALWTYFYWQSFYTSHFYLLHMLQGFSVVPTIFAIILTILSRKQFD
jgi:hypothetical protein